MRPVLVAVAVMWIGRPNRPARKPGAAPGAGAAPPSEAPDDGRRRHPAVRPGARRAHPTGPGPLFPVVKGGKWGYIDRTGRLVVSPRFDEASRFSEGLAPVRLGRQLGYADETGKVVLVPVHGPAGGTLHRSFSGGRAAIRSGARYGFIDRTGRLAVPARWLTAEDFSEGRALVCDEQGCGFVDPEGRYALAHTLNAYITSLPSQTGESWPGRSGCRSSDWRKISDRCACRRGNAQRLFDQRVLPMPASPSIKVILLRCS